jgi:Na+-driven multidrug efflux pump
VAWGETELGVAGITGVYYLVFALVGNGLNSGLQALDGQEGRGKQARRDRRMFSQSIWIALLFALVRDTYSPDLTGSLFSFCRT